MATNLTCVGADIAKSGLWINTRIYQDGEHLNADIYLVKDGQARVLKASVDLAPIAAAVAKYHRETLHRQRFEAAKVAGLIPNDIDFDEVGFGWGDLNPIKHIKKIAKGVVKVVSNPLDSLSNPMHIAEALDPTGLVHKVGRIKLVRQINNSVSTIVKTGAKGVQGFGQMALNNPAITGTALTALTAVFPPAAALTLPAMAYLPAASAANKGIGVASRVARGKANLLDAGMKAIMSGAASQMPIPQLAKNFEKFIPKGMDATSIVRKAVQGAVKQAGGAKGLSSLGPKQWGSVFKQAMPPQLKTIAREGLLATRGQIPSTAKLMPRVSNKALGMYAMASKAVQAVERAKGLRGLSQRVSFGAKLPKAASGLRKELSMLKLAQSRLDRLPPQERFRAQNAIAKRKAALIKRARNLGAIKRAIGNEMQVARKIGPVRIKAIRNEGARAALMIKQIRAGAQSSNPRVREKSRQALAAFKVVANSRNKVRQLSRGKLPGVSVSGRNIVGAPMRLAQFSEVMPTIGYHSAEAIEVGCRACGGTCGR